jgi:hypothetical protein
MGAPLKERQPHEMQWARHSKNGSSIQHTMNTNRALIYKPLIYMCSICTNCRMYLLLISKEALGETLRERARSTDSNDKASLFIN